MNAAAPFRAALSGAVVQTGADATRASATRFAWLSRVLALVALAALSGCTNLFFAPARDINRTPAELGLAYEDVHFETADGETLHGWFLPALVPGGKRAHGTVMFLHGRNRNIAGTIGSVEWLPARGFNVFLFDYRGYGRSTGTPSLWGMQQDLDAGWKRLLDDPRVDRDRVAVFGQSMGGALAIWHLSHSPYREYAKALVTEGAFTGYREVVRDFLGGLGGVTGSAAPWLAYLVDGGYRPVEAIQALPKIPLLIVHGANDTIVPVEHAKALFAAAHEPKELWIVPAAWHVGSFRGARDDNQARLTTFLEKALRPRGGFAEQH